MIPVNNGKHTHSYLVGLSFFDVNNFYICPDSLMIVNMFCMSTYLRNSDDFCKACAVWSLTHLWNAILIYRVRVGYGDTFVGRAKRQHVRITFLIKGGAEAAKNAKRGAPKKHLVVLVVFFVSE